MPRALLLLLVVTGCSHGWQYSEYDKPEGWPGSCTDGEWQSPIDLLTEYSEEFVVDPLEFFNYKTLNGTITNNGHGVAVHFDEDHCDSGVTGGMLRSQFILHELHFHWDSEHTINGWRFPLELHMVHFNKKYGTMSYAATQHDGLAVVGVLFKEAENGTDAMDILLEGVKPVSSRVNAKGRLPANFNPFDLLPEDRHQFFRYTGSLTTPPCSEVVTWTVMRSQVPVSKEQMKVFKLVSTDKGILEKNYRRLQDINEREVFLMSDSAANVLTSTLGVLLLSCAAVLYK